MGMYAYLILLSIFCVLVVVPMLLSGSSPPPPFLDEDRDVASRGRSVCGGVMADTPTSRIAMLFSVRSGRSRAG